MTSGVTSILILLLIRLFGAGGPASEKRMHTLAGHCYRFQEVYRNIGDSLITPDSATIAFQEVIRGLRETTASYKDSCHTSYRVGPVFPLKGYIPGRSIGGKGKGYRPKEFDFFNARIRKSHPAHDLFIRDKNQDAIDDLFCTPVDILAYTGGVVVAVEHHWQPESLWRGGNYIWVYDPCQEALHYYAHAGKVTVQSGQWLFAGQKIGEVGRTGFNASKPRSGTHLHFMCLQLTAAGLPEPVNTYEALMDALVVPFE